MSTCQHCGASVPAGEGEWAEHLAAEHPKAWDAWYHTKWQEQANYRRWEAQQWPVNLV